MKKRFLLNTLVFFIATVLSVTVFSQSIRDYRNAHARLLAKQENVRDKIRVEESINYARTLYSGKTAYGDIDHSYWDSDRIAPWESSEIPERKDLILGSFHMPCKNGHIINSKFGYRKQFGRHHNGVDLKAQIGDTIYATFSGIVRLTKFDRNGYGFYVVVRHENGLETLYGHLSKFLVKSNQYVKVGQPIALSGNTGRSTGPHLHYETRFMGKGINPESLINFSERRLISNNYTFRKNSSEGTIQSASNKPVTRRKRR